MNEKMRTLVLALALAGVLAAGCGRVLDGGTGSGGIDHPMAPDALVLRVHRGGGFMPIEYRLGELPWFSLTGDGRLITQGPQIEIYPPPALPNLQVRTITEEGIQEILRAAEEAGLMGELPDLGNPAIADAATTTFTVVAGGETHVIRAYALGDTLEGDPQLTGEQKAARSRLLAFERKLGDLGSWLPGGSLGAEGAFDFDELRVLVLGEPSFGPDEGVEQQEVDWPLAEPLSSFGRVPQDAPNVRCGSVKDEDLGRLMAKARSANALTRWRSGGETYYLVFRPLLPDESGCPAKVLDPA